MVAVAVRQLIFSFVNFISDDILSAVLALTLS